MTIREAWLSIANRNFLCNGVIDLEFKKLITEKQALHMRAQLELVEKQIRAARYDISAYWAIDSPERKKFARMAARGHAKDYVWEYEKSGFV